MLDSLPDGADVLAVHFSDLLIDAVAYGTPCHCRQLLDRGGNISLPANDGETPLWAAVTARQEAAYNVALLCQALRGRFTAHSEDTDDLRWRLAGEGPNGMSLAQWALKHRAHRLIGYLEAMGVPLNVSYEGGDLPLRTACMVRAQGFAAKAKP